MGGFLKRFIPFAAIIAMVLFILGFAKGFETVMTFAWVCYALFLALSLITFYFSVQTMEKKFSSFMGVFFVSIFSKLILSAIIVLIFKAKNDTTDVNFIIPFAIIYFSFLLFETIELVKLSRKVDAKTTPKPPLPK